MEQTTRAGFSANTIKIIAAVTMFIDHMGLMLFPGEVLFRIIGRISFPLFAFMIAEGCRYTKNKLRHILTIFSLAVVVQAVYYFYSKETDLNILFTFTFSIALIYALQYFKETLFDPSKKIYLKILVGAGALLAVFAVRYICKITSVDYGFRGCLLPVFAALLHPTKKNECRLLQKFDSIYWQMATFAIGLVYLVMGSGMIQSFSLVSLAILLLYSGERGKINMKYFFYIFYPAHFLVLELIKTLIK